MLHNLTHVSSSDSSRLEVLFKPPLGHRLASDEMPVSVAATVDSLLGQRVSDTES